MIPVREHVVGEQVADDELTYALRSFAAHLPHDRVWLVGGSQPWLRGVEHIPAEQSGTKWENAKALLRLACQLPEVSDPFLYANDDMFALHPIDEVPAYSLGTLDQMVAGYRRRSMYTAAALRTRDLLRSLGSSTWSFEVHTPIAVDKVGMLEVLDMTKDDPRLHERSIYGNLAGLTPLVVDDVKVYRDADPFPTSWWVSTTEQAFTRTRHGVRIRARFPDPCRYEREGTACL